MGLEEKLPSGVLLTTVERVVGAAGTRDDLTKWRWGPILPLEIQHPILGKIPILRRWTGPGIKEQSGNALTVKAVGRHFGPAERTTVNLADFDHSTLNIVTGQSGNKLKCVHRRKRMCAITHIQAVPRCGSAMCRPWKPQSGVPARIDQCTEARRSADYSSTIAATVA